MYIWANKINKFKYIFGNIFTLSCGGCVTRTSRLTENIILAIL